MTTASYIIVVICVLLTIAGMVWYVRLVKKGEEEQQTDQTEEAEGKKDDR